MLELRVLTADDWAVWRDLRLAALADAPYAFGSTLADWQHADEKRWRDRLSGSGHRNLIAYLDGEAVGMASGVPGEVPGTAELISMYVSPAGRGRGVGDGLVADIVAWARGTGATELRLGVVADNDHAVALYLRNGFTYTDGRPTDPRCERTMTRPTA